jgi:NADH-quinone oxidoreductase subunit L
MTWVLAVLGFLAVAGGYIGLPILWGLPNLFEKWLEPVFESSSHLVTSAHRGHSAEWGLMLFSVVIAFVGFLVARALYRDARSPIPGRLLADPNPLVRGVYRTVLNKYYVDEAYGAAVIRPGVRLARALAWWDVRVIDGIVNLVGSIGTLFGKLQGWIDFFFVDGLVNGVGALVTRAGRGLRHIQTGRIQSYVYSLTAGAVVLVLLGYLLGR